MRDLHTLSAKSGRGELQRTQQLHQGDLGLVAVVGAQPPALLWEPWASLDTENQGTEPNRLSCFCLIQRDEGSRKEGKKDKKMLEIFV